VLRFLLRRRYREWSRRAWFAGVSFDPLAFLIGWQLWMSWWKGDSWGIWISIGPLQLTCGTHGDPF
jgi:hypothetical protein